MSILILQLPSRSKLAVPGGEAASETSPEAQDVVHYVLSADGIEITREGHGRAGEWPKADQVIAMVAAADVSWHRITLPKVAMARMPAALSGMLEDNLLGEADQLHFALEPLSKSGHSSWVAACDRAWLEQWLTRCSQAQVELDRIVPSVWPDDPPCGWFQEASPASDALGAVQLTWSSLEGVASWPAHGGFARKLLPEPLPADVRWMATPSVAAPAERWLGAAVTVQTPAERMLQAAQSMWELRQFALAPRHHGLRRLSDQWRRFMSREWQPVRVGVAALVVLELLGLNAWGWHLEHVVRDKRQAEVSLLKRTHPQVQAVLNAPLQMQRENENLRVMSGQPASSDLESLLQSVALAWPAGTVLQSLTYDGSSVTLQGQGWSPMQTDALRQALENNHLRVESHEGRLVVSRGQASEAADSASAAD